MRNEATGLDIGFFVWCFLLFFGFVILMIRYAKSLDEASSNKLGTFFYFESLRVALTSRGQGFRPNYTIDAENDQFQQLYRTAFKLRNWFLFIWFSSFVAYFALKVLR